MGVYIYIYIHIYTYMYMYNILQCGSFFAQGSLARMDSTARGPLWGCRRRSPPSTSVDWPSWGFGFSLDIFFLGFWGASRSALPGANRGIGYGLQGLAI